MADRLPGQKSSRLQAIDVVRGFVMVLMTLDHSSTSFNAGRLVTDGAAMFRPGVVLDPLQFITRWVTHLCAPTFVFLAGTSLALSVTRRQRDGVPGSLIDPTGVDPRPAGRAVGVPTPRDSASPIDRDILIRGVLLIVLDTVWMGWVWRLGMPIQLGVLYAIGASMIGMIALRRLPAGVVGGLGIVVMVAGEAVTGLLDPTLTVSAATMSGGQVGSIIYLYPFLPWAGFMMLGWAVGMRLVGGGPGMRARDWLLLAGIAGATFVIVRGQNGYGNAHLLRSDGSWIEWLHVSKYPPSLAYAALELTITFALLALVWRWERPWKPLLVFGQTALFFYLIHVHLFKGTAVALGLYKHQGLGTTYIAWGAMLLVLYPCCRWYLGVKQRHPGSVLRFF